MKEKITAMKNHLFERYPSLKACESDIDSAFELIKRTYSLGGKILTCGNGGSCSDADHIVGELMKGFLLKREPTPEQETSLTEAFGCNETAKKFQQAIPAISLTAQSGIITAFANDVDPELVYAQLVFGYADEKDLVIGLSTSGNSKNVVNAICAAKAKGASTLSLTGTKQSRMSELSDVTIRVPECETYKIQELHLPVYHYLCAAIEEDCFGE